MNATDVTRKRQASCMVRIVDPAPRGRRRRKRRRWAVRERNDGGQVAETWPGGVVAGPAALSDRW